MKPKTKRVAAATIFAEYADTIVADLGEDIFVEAYNAIAAAGRESHPDRVIGRCVDCCNNFFMTSSKWAGSWYAKLAKEEATRLERTGEAFWLALKATARKRDLPQIAQHLQAILQLVPEREHAPPRSDVEQAVAKLLQRAGVRPQAKVAQLTVKIAERTATPADALRRKLDDLQQQQYVVVVLRASLEVPGTAIGAEHRRAAIQRRVMATAGLLAYAEHRIDISATLTPLEKRLYEDGNLSAEERETLSAELTGKAEQLREEGKRLEQRLKRYRASPGTIENYLSERATQTVSASSHRRGAHDADRPGAEKLILPAAKAR